MNITIRQLIYLREIARSRSFTEAANRLHTSQSNLSTSVRALEDIVGVRLINRSTKHFELTDSGRSFLAVSERVLDDLQAALESTSAISRLERGTLSVGAPTTHAATFLPDVIGRFHREHPNLELRLHEVPSRELFNMLRSREIELAIGTFLNVGNDIMTKALFEDELVVMAHPDLKLSGSCTWRDLLRLPLVSIVKTSSVGQLIEETAWDSIQRRFEPLMEVESWVSVVALTESLRAASIAPKKVAEQTKLRAGSGLLQIHSLHRPKIVRTISVAYLATHSLTPTAQAFVRLLEDSRDEYRPV
jgi:DNA-binding transcriptional LysR family regulator